MVGPQDGGFGFDQSINLANIFKKSKNRFVQGNFDENFMLLDSY